MRKRGRLAALGYSEDGDCVCCTACEQEAQIVVFAAHLDELRGRGCYLTGFSCSLYVADTTCLKWMCQDAPVIPLARYGGLADLDLFGVSLE